MIRFRPILRSWLSVKHRVSGELEIKMDETARETDKYWLVAAFVVGFLAVGFPYWQIPYAKVSLPDTLYGLGLLVVSVLAAAARGFGKARLLAVILVVGAAVPVAVLARVAFDTVKDPTSHNLWPLEFIIAAVVGLLCSSAGALVGSVPALLSSDGDAA